ncbi:hypothetical protein C1646_777467 [Rhizophagus diaphanus]|nr:hypothetical protein C1646_777467 [Rhizophagus diaphanus] [Rhizophagus sp. MUCL 43196]
MNGKVALRTLEEGLKDENYSGVGDPKDQENDGVNEVLENEENDRVEDPKSQENNKVEEGRKNELNAFLQDLPKELRDVYDSLPKDGKELFTSFRDNEVRKKYLTTVQSVKQKQRGQGFFIDVFYILLPLCASGIGVEVMLHYHVEPTLAISIFGLGVLFAEWIKDLLDLLEN